MKKAALFITVIMAISLSFGFASGLRINEIMYSPQYNNFYNEWVELYNDGNENVNLSEFTLCGKELISGYLNRSGNLHDDEGMILEAGKFALITDGGTGTEVYINFNVGANSLAVHVNAGSLCTGNALSNSGGTITLERNGEEYGGVNYEGGIEAGYSIEYHNENFLQSQNIDGTPGMENSNLNEGQNNENQNEDEGLGEEDDSDEYDGDESAGDENQSEDGETEVLQLLGSNYNAENITRPANRKKIILNPSPVEKETQKIKTSQEKIRNIIPYVFLVMLVFLIIFALLKKF